MMKTSFVYKKPTPIITDEAAMRNPDEWRWKPLFNYPQTEMHSAKICDEVERLNILFQNELKILSKHSKITVSLKATLYRKYADFLFTYNYNTCMSLRQKYNYSYDIPPAATATAPATALICNIL